MSLADPVISDIDEEWYRVKPALERLFAKSPEFGLVPSYVREACIDQRAQLWVSSEGFMVTRFQDDADSGDRTLLLWLGSRFDDATNPCHQYLPFFDGVAKYMNCKYIEVWSSRDGMERYLAKYDFELYARAFRKLV